MDVSRRNFLIGTASAFGAATMPDLQARILDAGRPILLAPNLVSKRMGTSNNCVLAVVRQIRFKERTRFGSGGAFDGSVRCL